MDEQDLVTRLRSIADTPIKPPDTFDERLWRRLESELSLVSAPVLPHISDSPDSDVSFRPGPSYWSRRSPAWAAAIGFAWVLGSGVLVWWLFQAGQADVANSDTPSELFTVAGPVELAAGDVLWPASDMTGTPSSVAEAFAVEVLGWTQAEVTETANGTCLTFPSRNAEACPPNATTLTIAQNRVEPLEIVVDTIGENEEGELWAVAQVGGGYTTDLLEATEMGTRIPLRTIDAAAAADITMRVGEDFRLVEVSAGTADLDTGYVDTELIPDSEEVLSILVRYLNSGGHVISAAGGPWNIFYEWAGPEPSGSEVTIAEGTYEGSSATWRMSAFNTTEGNLCLRLEGMGCVGEIPQTEHLGGLLTSAGLEAGVGARWCIYGPVRDADTVQIRLSDGIWINAPIYTNPTFDVDFYAYCGLGEQPAAGARALDIDGNVIDQVPETDNG